MTDRQLATDRVPAAQPAERPAFSDSRPETIYQARREAFARERERLTRRWNRVANLRLLAFLAGAVGVALGLWQRAPLWGLPALLSFAGFAALVRHHRWLGRARRRYAELARINDEALRRLARDWDALPLRHQFRAAPDHLYAADLDLFGRASLFHLLDNGLTRSGEATLRDWLLAPAPPATVHERQAAVAELAPLRDLRDDLAVQGRLIGEVRPDPTPFLVWAEREPWLVRRRGLLWVARLSVALLWLLFLAQLAGIVPYPLWLGPIVVNLVLRQLLERRARETIGQVAAQEGAFQHYAGAFELLSTARFSAPLSRQLQADLTVAGLAAHKCARRLHWLAGLAIPRSTLSYSLVQTLTLWDVQLLAALERWQVVAGRHARGWLAALGTTEALAALAGLAHDHPDWAYPDLDPAADTFDARGLGHPLLPDALRVVNDVTVGPPGTFLLVTGSNMSGKSTLLRAIGVNAVLAGAGGPVCASALRLPPAALATSMRVQDSLAHGVSYFLAELRRLKHVVDAAHEASAPDGRRALYLLDEILQGTNTFERQIAARRIILHLVARGAIGAVSTHDLTLADSPKLAAAARLLHFTETFSEGPSGPTMVFDYTARPGLAQSTNALRLMALVGLALDGEGEQSGGE